MPQQRDDHKEVQLPEAELEVLACLHDLGEAEAAQVRDYLQGNRPLTHASVTTLLRRLESKQLIDRRKADVGKSFVYFPIRDPETTFQDVAGRMLQRVFRNDTVSMISSLFGAKQPSRQELEELRELVDGLYDKADRADHRRNDSSRLGGKRKRRSSGEAALRAGRGKERS